MAFSPSSSSVSPVPAAGSHQDGGAPSIPQALWNFRVPLYITHKAQGPSSSSSPFITSVPRFSYLAQLLPRLSCFFDLPCSSFHHEGIQLRNLPVGLLVDLYQPRLPWRLDLGDGDEWDIGDTFLNGVKEVSYGPNHFHRRKRTHADDALSRTNNSQADFVRNGNAKQIMSLSKEHTTALWNAVQDSKLRLFNFSPVLNKSTGLSSDPARFISSIKVPHNPAWEPGRTIPTLPRHRASFSGVEMIQPNKPNHARRPTTRLAPTAVKLPHPH